MSNNRYRAAIWLSQVVGRDVKAYLPEESCKLIYDFKNLADLFESSNDELFLHDWSPLITPVSKAVEATMQKIADDCNLNIKNSDKLGSFFNEDNVEKNIKALTSKVTVQIAKDELQQTLSELRVSLKRYRHRPLHFSHKLDSYALAQAQGVSAICSVGNTVKILLDQDIIELPVKPVDTSESNGLDDVPF